MHAAETVIDPLAFRSKVCDIQNRFQHSPRCPSQAAMLDDGLLRLIFAICVGNSGCLKRNVLAGPFTDQYASVETLLPANVSYALAQQSLWVLKSCLEPRGPSYNPTFPLHITIW